MWKKKKGHKCPGKRVKLVPLEKKCKICFQVKKGHICPGIKKFNIIKCCFKILLKYILTFPVVVNMNEISIFYYWIK